eukprot:3527224-Prymnesium_polylepis.1
MASGPNYNAPGACCPVRGHAHRNVHCVECGGQWAGRSQWTVDAWVLGVLGVLGMLGMLGVLGVLGLHGLHVGGGIGCWVMGGGRWAMALRWRALLKWMVNVQVLGGGWNVVSTSCKRP